MAAWTDFFGRECLMAPIPPTRCSLGSHAGQPRSTKTGPRAGLTSGSPPDCGGRCWPPADHTATRVQLCTYQESRMEVVYTRSTVRSSVWGRRLRGPPGRAFGPPEGASSHTGLQAHGLRRRSTGATTIVHDVTLRGRSWVRTTANGPTSQRTPGCQLPPRGDRRRGSCFDERPICEGADAPERLQVNLARGRSRDRRAGENPGANCLRFPCACVSLALGWCHDDPDTDRARRRRF